MSNNYNEDAVEQMVDDVESSDDPLVTLLELDPGDYDLYQ